jgi:hypothetical protein
MEFLVFGLPLGILVLIGLGIYRSLHRRRTGPTVGATYLNEVTAVFYGTKRAQLDHRDSWSMMREEESASGPPATGLDLDQGIMVLRPDGPDTAR